MIALSLIFLATISGLLFISVALRHERTTPGQPTDHRSSRFASPAPLVQALCFTLASELKSWVIIVEKKQDKFTIRAGAPAHPRLAPADKTALNWCFDNALPTSVGMRLSAGFDWLFVPVVIGKRVRAVLGLARRSVGASLGLTDDPDISLAVQALHRMYGEDQRWPVCAVPFARIVAAQADEVSEQRGHD